MNASTITATLAAFRRALTAEKRRAQGIETYLKELTAFASAVDPLAPSDLTRAHIRDYQEDRAHLSAASLNKTLSALRCWVRWAITRDLMPSDPTAGMRRVKDTCDPPRVLNQAALRQLDTLLHGNPGDLRPCTYRRYQRALLLMLYAGVRLTECGGLEWCDVDLDRREVTIPSRIAKGGRARIVPLHSRLISVLDAVPPNERRSLVVGLQASSIPHIFDRWLDRHGIRASPHDLRRTFATELRRRGVDSREIQLLLGHASLATTERYLAVVEVAQRRAVVALPERWD